MPQLFDYQSNDVVNIIKEFNYVDRLLYQLSTGGGKTFIFSFLTKEWLELHPGKRVLILCHKDELIHQTIGSLNSIGVTCEAVTRKTKTIKHNAELYVAMIETANNRLKKDKDFFKDVDLVIADECHILIFDKVYDYFTKSKILGCSATPVLDKKVNYYKCRYCKSEDITPGKCCGQDRNEWIKPLTLSTIYQNIVVGVSIKYLIEINRLVPEISFVKHYTDDSNLSMGSDGEFTAESMDEAYSNKKAVFNCVKNYEEIALGKKTIVFNPTTTANKMVYDRFKAKGYNVRMYDSVHSKESERKEIVEWFHNSKDGILCNVGCFTTGFDITDVEAIMLNRPTNSLSLYLQMVGRGGRVTTRIYKPHFLLIDGGNNVKRFNEWSDDSRDWYKIFFHGIWEPRKKRGKNDVEDVQYCDGCGSLYAKNLNVCPNCGHEIKPKPKANVSESEDVMAPIREIPPPDPKKIHAYTVGLNQNINFAFRILINQIFDMFIFYRVYKEQYEEKMKVGKLKTSVFKMIDENYYYLIAQDDLIKVDPQTGATGNMKLIKPNTIYNKIIDKLNQFYKITPIEKTTPINEGSINFF